MRNKIAAMAATVLVAGAALAATAPSASASDPGGGTTWDHTWKTTDAKHGGTIYIQEHGDIMMICDTAADGVAPRAQVAYESPITGAEVYYTLVGAGGNGACTTHRASNGYPYDLPEGQEIGVTIYLGLSFGSDNPEGFLNDH